jgi:hypothetical protein
MTHVGGFKFHGSKFVNVKNGMYIDCMYVGLSLLAWIDQVKMCHVFLQHLIMQLCIF